MPIYACTKTIQIGGASSPPPRFIPKVGISRDHKGSKIVSSILYYARAVNMTVLMALSTIAAEQMLATERTLEQCTQLLDYLAHNADAKV